MCTIWTYKEVVDPGRRVRGISKAQPFKRSKDDYITCRVSGNGELIEGFPAYSERLHYVTRYDKGATVQVSQYSVYMA